MRWSPVAKASFHSFSVDDRRDALAVAEGLSGRGAYLLEKDIWVVEILRILFAAPFGENLVFKGGTSLSKAWGAITRFSEDIDITYDIRAFAPNLGAGRGAEVLPATRSQARRWTREIREKLDDWVREHALAAVEDGLNRAGLPARVRADDDQLHVDYQALFDREYLVRSEVMVEFGARSTGEPCETRSVTCDAADFLPDIAFPVASPSVMLPERTFWEKATAAHVFCLQQRQRGDRLSRHWHDIVRLDDAGFAAKALADRVLAVARHKESFFREKDVEGNWIDYTAAVLGELRLVPTGVARSALAEDYAGMLSAGMLSAGMLLDAGESFDELMARCANIEASANNMQAHDGTFV